MRARTGTTFALMLALGGCTAARMAGFDALAAGGGLERIDVTGVPGWSEGTFHFGVTAGTVRRIAAEDAIGWGRANGAPFESVRVGAAVRHGAIEVAIDRDDLGGRIEARCRYVRTERRDTAFGIDVATTVRPLQLACAYRVGGREAGTLALAAVPAPGIVEARGGSLRIDGRTLRLSSRHGIAGAVAGTSAPIGYVVETIDGVVVGAVETAGGSTRRMLLTRTAGDRAAAAMALLTVALFQDPGDVG